ncbi:MAG: N-6 DNA methylase [Microthrixaceae bacterium]
MTGRPPDQQVDIGDLARREVAQYEASLHTDDRKRRGVHYTPLELARFLVGRAMGRFDRPPLNVCDPTCGGGIFLLAAAEVLAERGVDPVEILQERLHGADIDGEALRLARRLLVGWAKERIGRDCQDISVPGLIQADFLAGVPDAWREPNSFDLVVGNPPFLNQLRSRTTRSSTTSAAIRERFGAVGAYSDTASLILLGSVQMLADGGVLTMIQPQSFLSSRDTTGVRDTLLESTSLLEVWSSDASFFDAAVRVCAVTVRAPEARTSRADRRGLGRRGAGPGNADAGSGDGAVGSADGAVGGADVVGATESEGEEANDVEVMWGGDGDGIGKAVHTRVLRPNPTESWGPIFARAVGLPVVGRTGGMRVGDIAGATAGFRDEFYALAGACVDDPSNGAGTDRDEVLNRGDSEQAPNSCGPVRPRLITVGMIDPCHLTWGMRPRRLGGVSRLAPQLDMAALQAASAPVHRWASDRMVPKVLVATQTRIIEAAVDQDGDCVPVTPVISVEPLRDWQRTLTGSLGNPSHSEIDLWWLVAALSAPSVAADALGRHLGTGLSGGSLRISARSVLDLELPIDIAWWEAGAIAARRVAEADPVDRADALAELGISMCRAHRLDPSSGLLDWWLGLAVASCLTRGTKIV